MGSTAVADVNGDGRNDVVVLFPDNSVFSDTLLVFNQTPTRSLDVGDVVATAATSGDGMTTGDLNGDGRADIAIPVVNGVDVLLQSGGHLSDPVLVAAPSTPSQLAIADVDGDTHPDLVVAGSFGIRVLEGPAFTTSVNVTNALATLSVAVGDVNGDGVADIVATATSVVRTYTQSPVGTFSASSTSLSSASDVAVGDVTHDGKDDVVASVRSLSGAVGVMRQSGGVLQAPVSTSTHARPEPIAISDVDKDGRNDVVVLHDSTGEVGVLYQQGGGALGSEQWFDFDDFASRYDARALAVGDIDRDGYPDVVAATSFGISMLIQNPGVVPTLETTWVRDAQPAALATDVLPGVTPTITLTRAATNVGSGTVKLFDEGGTEVATGIGWDAGSKTITVTPASALADGSYVVRVDGMQDGSGADLGTYADPFTVGTAADEAAPQTSLVSPPSGYRTAAHETLRFSANEAGSVFECSLDNRAYRVCVSPFSVTVAPGKHTLRVFARDIAGNEDASPAAASWTYRPTPHGYWLISQAGRVYPFGTVKSFGNAATTIAADLEPSPSGFGYWIVDSNGHVFAFGDAHRYGSASGLASGESVTSISRTATGKGYWLVTSRGRVFAFGDAHFYGDLRYKAVCCSVVEVVSTPTGHGYYLAASNGSVFVFGDARSYGSAARLQPPAPIRTLVRDPDGVGYWQVSFDGTVYSFHATPHGSLATKDRTRFITGMIAFRDAYVMVGSDGSGFNFSSGSSYGSLTGHPPSSAIVSLAGYG
jgi:hypothetical protein